MVARVDSLDLAALARAWAQREQSGAFAGPASTRDTVQATVGTARLWIDYGRPALRGRNVWVNGVLGDTLWRTGANAATQLRSDVDLVVGGATVPAGTYTLWTAATPSGYRLVINRQAGNNYDASRDLVRVPLREQRPGARRALHDRRRAAELRRRAVDAHLGNEAAERSGRAEMNLMSRLLNYFFKGVVLLAPLAFTVYVCVRVFATIDGWLGTRSPVSASSRRSCSSRCSASSRRAS